MSEPYLIIAEKAWRLYVLENHIKKDGDKHECANYWHKLSAKDQIVWAFKAGSIENE